MKAVSCLLLTKPVIYGSVLDSVEDFCGHGYQHIFLSHFKV